LRIASARSASLAAFALVAALAAPQRALAANAVEAWTPERIAALDADLDALLADPALRGAHAGMLAVDTASGAVLYAHNADDAFQPASTLKLLVGSAALERLRPAYRFHTQVEAVPAPAGASGEALVLRAGGDPFLTLRDLDDAARAVAASGTHSVSGVYVDDSRYDGEAYAPGWTWDDFAYDYAPRISALSLEENVLHLSVTPGAAPGDAAIVTADPPGRVAAGAACERARDSALAVVANATTSAAGLDSTLDVRANEGGCLEAIGTVPLGAAPESLDAAVSAPLVYAREALAAALRAHGVGVTSGANVPDSATELTDADVRFRVSSGRVLWQHTSAPLSTWLGPLFWIPSDNLAGEVLLKELGFATAGAPGSRASGIAFETQWLQSIGVDPATVTLADGCGMSQYDRVTPRDLVAVLQHDWNGPYRALVLDSLPLGGVRGTIEGVAGTPAAGRVYAKTGSMRHVRALAGYLVTQRHGEVTFVFTVDDWLGDYPALAALRARFLSRVVSD